MAVDIRSASSERCCGVSPASSRAAAAARRASASTSSSSDCGFSGKKSPYWDMNSANAASVSSPRASASSRVFSDPIMSRMRAKSSGVAPSRACFMPLNWLSRTSRRSSSEIFS